MTPPKESSPSPASRERVAWAKPVSGEGRRRVRAIGVAEHRNPHPARCARHPLPRCGRGAILALAAAVALLLTSGTGMAQSAATGIGAAALGIPGGATPGVSGSGIPLGATELGDDGLSPGTDPTLTVPGGDLSGSLDAPPLAMPGVAGWGVSPNGLSPDVMAPQCAMPGTSLC